MAVEPAWAKSLKIKWIGEKCCPGAKKPPSAGLQPSLEGKQKRVTQRRADTELLSHQKVSLKGRGRGLRIVTLLQSYKQWQHTMNL